MLRGAELTLAGDAHALADRIRKDAKLEAQNLLDLARSEEKIIVAAAEQDVLARAASLLEALEQQHAQFLQHAQDLLIDLSQAVFDRLAAETSDRERVAICVRRILLEAPNNIVNAVLRVHPEDLSLLPSIEWDVKTDAGMVRGACRLEASSGEWHAEFSAAVSVLRGALENFREKRGRD